MSVQYIRILNPWFLELDNNGRPAADYLVWTLAAGTVDTMVTTYTDRLLTSPNTNPIVLNARGEAAIFTNVSLKLVFTAPGGDLTSPIWTQDYVTEQLSSLNNIGAAVGTVNNHYTVNTVPAYTSIADGFTLVMIPDVNSAPTIGTKVFTGTGIDDLTFSGGFLGDTNSQFEVQIQACWVAPPARPTAALSAVVGATPPTVGDHIVKITFVTAEGETTLGLASVTVAADGTHKIDLSNIPLGPAGVTDRNVYMTKAGGSDFFLVDAVGDNTTTTYAIDTPDASLVTAAPTDNTTGSGAGTDKVEWRQDAGAWHTGIVITPSVVQHMLLGVDFTFAEATGHIKGDKWVVPVVPPAQLDFCGLGSSIIYKMSGGVLVVIEDDIQQGVPATLVWSADNACWILNNPSLPVLQELQPSFVIKEIIGDAAVTAVEARKFLSCSNGPTLTVAPLSSMAGVDFWVASKDGLVVTVQVTGGTDLIMEPFGGAGVTSVTVGNGWDRVRFASNGAYLAIVEAISVKSGFQLIEIGDSPYSMAWPLGLVAAKVTAMAGGGGGGAGFGGGGGAGGMKSRYLTVVPGQVDVITIGAGGAKGEIADTGDAGDGGDTTVGSLLTALGGKGGKGSIGSTTGGLPGDGTGLAGTDGDGVTEHGIGGSNFPAQVLGDYANGGDGGEGGADGVAGKPGAVLVEWFG